MTTPVGTPTSISTLLASKAATTATPTDATTKGVGTLGKDDFLKMLVAQLKNQDPTSPMQGTEFAAQLAQFSNVEQLINIGTKLDAQAATAAQGQLTAQTSLGASLIGRDVLVDGNDLTVATGSSSTLVDISLSAAAKTLKVSVLDSKGKEVLSENFSAIQSGQQKLALDTGSLDPGAYTYQVTALGADDKPVTVTPYETARVDGISFKDGAIQLRVGNRIIPLLNVIEIKALAPLATLPLPPVTESTTP